MSYYKKEAIPVAWLEKELSDLKFYFSAEYYSHIRNLFEKAKEMEKEIIIEAYYIGNSDGMTEYMTGHRMDYQKGFDGGEDYYSKSFKSKIKIK
jgi:hypothetical protein